MTRPREFRWQSLEEAMTLSLNRPTRILLEAVLQRSKGAAAS